MTDTPETTVQPLSALAPDTILQDRYRVVRKLGNGGMGTVYEAVDERLGITVALKETLSSEASVRKQFEHEARLLASMQHPALPRVTDYFMEDNRAVLVMQFIEGVDLARIIAQQPGPFPKDQVIAWADQLLDALMYLHSRDRQVIHRDIKPHNLKLTASGQIALLDFGLAKAQSADPTVTNSAAFFGYTRQYAPLEQIEDRRAHPRNDIYALGATLYHLLTGVKPPDALVRAAALVNGQPDPLLPANQIHHIVGQEIAAILMQAMAQKPEDRFASASEFREALRRVGRRRAERVEPEPCEIKRNESTPKIEMVESRKRFGPGSATALLMAMFMIGAGALDSAQNWFDAPGKMTSSSPSESGKRRSTVAQKNEEGLESNGTRLAEKTYFNDGTNARENTIRHRETVLKNRPPSTKRPATQQLAAPIIHLPEAELNR